MLPNMKIILNLHHHQSARFVYKKWWAWPTTR